jgi:hypothetical protein
MITQAPKFIEKQQNDSEAVKKTQTHTLTPGWRDTP